jgi:glycosyltransferase involved in cell wall biosynthesis
MADDIAGHSIVDLTYGLESVLTQTVTDWEMWIGEACTDETESVVRGFADPRIHFLNLPRQTGDQAGPNNEGLRLFRGRYIAYLNHDDLWLPDHLAVGVDALQQTGADLVWPLIVKRHTDGRYTCDALNDPPRRTRHISSCRPRFGSCAASSRTRSGRGRHHSECYAAPSRASCRQRSASFIAIYGCLIAFGRASWRLRQNASSRRTRRSINRSRMTRGGFAKRLPLDTDKIPYRFRVVEALPLMRPPFAGVKEPSEP